MTITADALTAWLLTYEQAPVSFLRRSWRDDANVPAEMRAQRHERLGPYIDAEDKALKPASRLLMIESDEYGYDRWKETFLNRDPNWQAMHFAEYQQLLGEIPSDHLFYAAFQFQDNEVRSEIFIDNMNVMLSNDNLTVRGQLPLAVASILVGDHITKVCGHEVFQEQDIVLTDFIPMPWQRYLVERRKIITID